ncbi:chemotaxis protein CheW [Vibrio sp.]|uniref:chemotaxis protein CheW n=1 Tax=Vibrio sp. TaxID=678 RepID=UPI003D153558
MSNGHLLSSEQALDDYFNSLLEEPAAESLPDDNQWQPAPEPVELEPQPVLAAAETEVEPRSFIDPKDAEVEVPNLEDVERLLKQLESANPVAELQLEQVMQQNTEQLSSNAGAEKSVEADSTPLAQPDEIQEWDIIEPEAEVAVAEVVEPAESLTEEVNTETESLTQPETQSSGADFSDWQNRIRNEDFQVLYFEVNSVTFAVPLDELGGIHRLTELNHLIGRPAWYLGLQTSRDNQLDVVDTAKWVMAEKLQDDSHQADYQYIVMLGESMWGLACVQLLGTELLTTDKIRWREQVGKRPWLAGMVKEKMCALIHVEALIAMLNAGLDVKALEH